jgi:hypothetical protein
MFEIEALIELLVEKGILTKDELMAKYRNLPRKMKGKGRRKLLLS